MSSTLLGNISSIENNFTYFLFSSNQDTTYKDSISIVSETRNSKEKNKSPGKAMLYSAMFPGLGQAYMGKWKRRLIYLALDAVSAGYLYQNNKRAEERKKEYESNAAEHWDFATWIHDYYKWYQYDYENPESEWNSIREVFVNNTDEYCIDPPYCYIDIWDHSHSVKFLYNTNTISSNSDDFQEIFEELCGNSSIDAQCSNTIQELEDIISQNSVDVIEDHHFYEGIQKYDMFFAGWDDNADAEVINSGNNNNNVTSPNQRHYQSIYSDYNYIKTLAGRGGNFMLINRFVSMIDGLFLAKKWNIEHVVELNLDVYPDLRNKLGLGGVQLTMGWK